MDPYRTLGLPRDATQADVRRAYRRLARRYHPDHNRSPSAEERMKRINGAYEVLGDPARRAAWDERFGPRPAARARRRRNGERPAASSCRHTYIRVHRSTDGRYSSDEHTEVARCVRCALERVTERFGTERWVRWKAPAETAWRSRAYHSRPRPDPGSPENAPAAHARRPLWKTAHVAVAGLGGVLGLTWWVAAVVVVATGNGQSTPGSFGLPVLLGWGAGWAAGFVLTLPWRLADAGRAGKPS